MDIEIKSQPFTKEELEKIEEGLASGHIRRFGAIVDHQKLKFSHNALIAWRKNSLSQPAIRKLKEKNYISHIYLRKAHRFWPYGLYTMAHAKTREELDLYIRELSDLLKLKDYRILNTIKEFKKTSFKPKWKNI